MRDLMKAAAEWLRADAAIKHEELRLLEFGTYARGLEDGRADTMAEYGIDAPFEPADSEDDE